MAQASNENIFGDIERSIKPYRQDFPTFSRLPQKGRTQQEIIDLMNSLYSIEESRWKDGYVSGAVYHGDEYHIDWNNEGNTRNCARIHRVPSCMRGGAWRRSRAPTICMVASSPP